MLARTCSHMNCKLQSVSYHAYNFTAILKTRMWANALRDGRPAEYRWSPLFNTTKFG